MLAGHPFSYPDLPRPPPAITRAVTEYLSTHAVLAVRVGLPASDTASGTTLDRRTPAGAHHSAPVSPRGEAETHRAHPQSIATPWSIVAALPAPFRGPPPFSDANWEMPHALTHLHITFLLRASRTSLLISSTVACLLFNLIIYVCLETLTGESLHVRRTLSFQ